MRSCRSAIPTGRPSPGISKTVTPPTVHFRQMTEPEYEDFRERSVPDYADDLVRSRGMSPEAALRASSETYPATLADAVAPGRTWVLRALDAEGQAVGWLWLGPDPFRADGVFVYDIEIDESQRGRGLGKATMLAAEDVAREAGLRHIRLNVFGWNTRAEGLYRSLGYTTGSTQLGKPLQGPVW
jgi:ribosomal protein S18 acetylase RimI-like enzyme